MFGAPPLLLWVSLGAGVRQTFACRIAQSVEHWSNKPTVAGSSPVLTLFFDFLTFLLGLGLGLGKDVSEGACGFASCYASGCERY
jgi:hypothetical protein